MEEPGPDATPPMNTPSEPYKTSPPKELVKAHVAANDRKELKSAYPEFVKTVPASKMLELLQKELSTKHIPNTASLMLSSESVDRDYVRYLNRLSSMVGNTLGEKQYRIKFFTCGKRTSHDHPTGTKCCPDFVAVKQDFSVPVDSDLDPEESQAASNFYWSQVEATGENKSKGKRAYEDHVQAASYTGLLLQTRPDLVSVLGIVVEPKEFKLLLTNACGVYYMDPVVWDFPDAGELLFTWIQRLYRPEVDETITRSYEPKPSESIANFPSKPTFMIQHRDKEFEGCKILTVGSPFNRRTTVFETKDNKVIKEQYIELTRRFKEGPILDKIHRGGRFPGVVEHEGYDVVKRKCTKHTSDEPGTVQSGDSITIQADLVAVWEGEEMKKIRLVMRDKATPLMDVETPLDILILAYDLLEVIRHLYIKRHILHRDISVGNVLCRSEYPEVGSGFAQDVSDMCFAAHLLGDKIPEPRAGRLDTKVILVDYDMSLDCRQQSAKHPTSRMGTFMFMARRVRSDKVPEDHFFYPMPQLDPVLKTRYREYLPGRLQAFPPNTKIFHDASEGKIEPFQHKLAYDAESVFWVLLYWSMQARPADSKVDPLMREYWDAFTGGKNKLDPRAKFFINGDFPEDFLHESYQELETLFESMANLLKGYPEVLGDTDPHRTHAEYLVEAFQRLILNFLFKHYDDRFMRIKKNPKPRKFTSEMHSEQESSSSQVTKAKGSGSLLSQSGGTRPLVMGAGGSSSHKRRFEFGDQLEVQKGVQGGV